MADSGLQDQPGALRCLDVSDMQSTRGLDARGLSAQREPLRALRDQSCFLEDESVGAGFPELTGRHRSRQTNQETSSLFSSDSLKSKSLKKAWESLLISLPWTRQSSEGKRSVICSCIVQS